MVGVVVQFARDVSDGGDTSIAQEDVPGGSVAFFLKERADVNGGCAVCCLCYSAAVTVMGVIRFSRR